jgi:hypothetical protein
MINTLNLFGAAVVERVSTNQFLETFRSIVKSLAMSEKTKAMLGDLAAVTPTEPPAKPGGGEMTICEMYPDLASQEIDFLMTKYTGNMKRG